MTATNLSLIAGVLAGIPIVMFLLNFPRFRRAPMAHPEGDEPRISILIPARDEERSIAACVEAALSSVDVSIEVIVLDDYSRDQTAEIVRKLAANDPRVRLEPAPALPDGWCGKQHACDSLSRLAKHDLLLFIDADVRLSPDAATRAVAFMNRSRAALVSGFPRQETESPLEKMLIPLIHIVLLDYLPMGAMRLLALPALGAGCGQFFLTRRREYEASGGHGAIRRSLHDGITLPRAFRAAGFMTDIFDATDIAVCRMYRSSAECWRGLAKNATEGMASPTAIIPWSVLLLGGHVLPFVMLPVLWMGGNADIRALATVGGAITCLYLMRAAAAVRFRQSWLAMMLHPLAVTLLVAVQWSALLRQLAGRPAAWKGRAYTAVATK